jgi:hypothetical protein
MDTRASAAIGTVAGVGTDVLIEKLAPRQRTLALAAGLVTAAAIYPIARRKRSFGAPLLREVAGLVVAGAIVSTAAQDRSTRTRNLVAAGWAAHAAFDVLHDTGRDSAIPSWYPAMCAGYDLAVAGRLVTA